MAENVKWGRQLETDNIAEKHAGRRVKIEKIEVGYSDEFTSDFVDVSTEVVDTLKTKDGEEIQVRANRRYWLIKGEDGALNWKSMSYISGLLKMCGASTPAELVGKTVILQLTDPREKDGKRFLTF